MLHVFRILHREDLLVHVAAWALGVLLALAIGAIALVLVPAPASAAMKSVSPTADPFVPVLPGYTAPITRTHTTISGLHLAAATGDTLYYHSGTYNERLQDTTWPAGVNNLTVLGASNLTTIIDHTTLDRAVYEVGQSTNSGHTVKWLRIRGTTTGTGIQGQFALCIGGARNVTISGVTVSGWFSNVIEHGLSPGNGCDDVTIENCVFSSTYDASYSSRAAIWFDPNSGNPTNVTIQDCFFDFSNYTSGGSAGFNLRGVTNFIFRRNGVINMPPANVAGATGITVAGTAPSALSSNVTFEDFDLIVPPFVAPATAYVTINVGGVTGAGGIVDDVLIQRVGISTPTEEGYFGIKIEADYDGPPGADDTYSDNVSIIDCVVTSGNTGIGFHENARGGVISGCAVYGPGKGTAVSPAYAFVLEDARQCTITNSFAEGWARGVSHSFSGNTAGPGDSTPTWKNYHNRIVGNVFKDLVTGHWMQRFEGPPASGSEDTDSLLVAQGNVYINVDAIAATFDEGDPVATGVPMDLATWQAYAPPGYPAIGIDRWEHAAGDREYDSTTAAGLRRARGLPSGFFKTLGRGLDAK